jgi:antitoxin (DNA-binding transcriptional repressor) of toxin-antitoxin stability system
MMQVSITEFKKSFKTIAAYVDKGGEVVITRYGIPYQRFVAYKATKVKPVENK